MKSIYIICVENLHTAINTMIYVRVNSRNAILLRCLQDVNGIDIARGNQGSRSFPQPLLKNGLGFFKMLEMDLPRNPVPKFSMALSDASPKFWFESVVFKHAMSQAMISNLNKPFFQAFFKIATS